jgi:Trk K+ transport system NAD-binding subunit
MQGAGHHKDLTGRRFAVFGGDGRLAKAVTSEFQDRGAHVEAVTLEAIEDALRGGRFECFLAVAEEHEANLRAALVASEAADGLPVVIRAFDPILAEEIEREREDAPIRVRGAYSVAHLAAPDFVAAALLADDEENVVTLRLGDQYVNVCRIRVRAARRRWPRNGRIAGRTPAQVFEEHRCQVLGRCEPGAECRTADASALRDGEHVLLGGRLHDVLDVARRQSLRRRPNVRRPAPVEPRRHPLNTAAWAVREAWSYLSMRLVRVILLLFALVSAAVLISPAKGLPNQFQLWVLTALGNPNPNPAATADTLQVVLSAVGLLAGGIALGLGISLMSAYFIERRLDEAMLRRARWMRYHVVVVGLGDVGQQIAKLLDALGVRCVVLDATDERRRLRLPRTPVISGDLESGLRSAGVHRAGSVIAASEDNLLNVEACLRAKRDGPEEIRTIARIFDEDKLQRGAKGFGVDRHIAAVSIAAPAFVEAALSEECLRTFDAGRHELSALRWPSGHPFGSRQMERWHAEGVRLLAVWEDGAIRAPESETTGLGEHQAGILAGPEAAVGQVLDELRRRRPHDAPALRLAS